MSKEKKPLPIPEAGSLALLALGAEGYRAWQAERERRAKEEADEA